MGKNRERKIVERTTKEVQAISTLEIPQLRVEGTPIQPPNVAMIANATYSIKFSDMWKDILDNHEGEINQAIKKFAAAYYTTLSPTTLSDIKTRLGYVIENSMSLFAAICTAWKFQNCNQFEDEDGRALSKVLNNAKHTASIIDTKDGNTYCTQNVTFGISNSDWKKKVLKKLKSVYLSKLNKDFIYTYFGHFIDLDPSFEGSQRLVSFIPYSFMDQYGEVAHEAVGKTAESFYQYLDDLEDVIDTSYNMYPFFDGLLEYLHLTNPGEEYDFTRDLAQMRLNVIKDSNGSTAKLIYMLVASEDNPGDELSESNYSRFCLVKTDVDGSDFEVYERSNTAAKTLAYVDRVQVNVDSIVNALRGNFVPINIVEMVRKVEAYNVSSNTIVPGGYGIWVLNPFFLTTYLTNFTSAQWLAMNDLNRRYYELGYPHDCLTLLINTLVDDPDDTDNHDGVDKLIGNARYTFTPSSGDFIISPDDIESVISDACYSLVFSEYIHVEEVVNTLDNNGSNK